MYFNGKWNYRKLEHTNLFHFQFPVIWYFNIFMFKNVFSKWNAWKMKLVKNWTLYVVPISITSSLISIFLMKNILFSKWNTWKMKLLTYRTHQFVLFSISNSLITIFLMFLCLWIYFSQNEQMKNETGGIWTTPICSIFNSKSFDIKCGMSGKWNLLNDTILSVAHELHFWLSHMIVKVLI